MISTKFQRQRQHPRHTFSVWTEFTVPTGKKAVDAREACYWSHACKQELQAEEQRRETQWHPRVYISVKKRAPYNSRNPMMITLTRQNPWSKARTAPFFAAAPSHWLLGGCWLLEREEYRTLCCCPLPLVARGALAAREGRVPHPLLLPPPLVGWGGVGVNSGGADVGCRHGGIAGGEDSTFSPFSEAMAESMVRGLQAQRNERNISTPTTRANPNTAESMVKTRAPCLRHSPSEVMLTLTRQNPWLNPSTVPAPPHLLLLLRPTHHRLLPASWVLLLQRC
jgi:hypothetical protein